MDENVHRSAYLVCLDQCGYRTFDNGRRKLVDTVAMNDVNNVILL